MENTFGAEYLESVETPAYGSEGYSYTMAMKWHGHIWAGNIVCRYDAPCIFVPELMLE